MPLLFKLLDQLTESAHRLRDPDLIRFAEEYIRDANDDLLATDGRTAERGLAAGGCRRAH